MKRIIIASIPEKIAYVHHKPRLVNIGCNWSLDWFFYTMDGMQKVTKARLADPSDNKALNSAMNRVTGYREPTRAKLTVINNEPIKNIRIISANQHSKGIRYGAIVNNFYIELEDDMMVDTILHGGINTDGVLNGEYIWGKFNSAFKLVRIGSKKYNFLQGIESRKTLPKISKRDLEIGGVYVNWLGDKAILLGFVNSVQYKYPEKSTKDFSDTFSTKTVDKIFIRNGLLFYNLTALRHDVVDYERAIKSFNPRLDGWKTEIVQRNNFVQKLGNVRLDKNFVSIIRKHITSRMKDHILEFLGQKPYDTKWGKLDKYVLVSHICRYSQYLNMYKCGAPKCELFDLNKYLLFG